MSTIDFFVASKALADVICKVETSTCFPAAPHLLVAVEFYPRATGLFRLEFQAPEPLPLDKVAEEDFEDVEVCYAIPLLLAQQALGASLRDDIPCSIVEQMVTLAYAAWAEQVQQELGAITGSKVTPGARSNTPRLVLKPALGKAKHSQTFANIPLRAARWLRDRFQEMAVLTIINNLNNPPPWWQRDSLLDPIGRSEAHA